MKSNTRMLRVVLLFLLALGGLAIADPAPPANFTAGQPVEVREGDSWSPATFEKNEGRKYQIRYTEGGTEEWVTADRIRMPGSAGAGTKPADAKNDEAAAKPKRVVYDASQKLEAKWGGLWREVTIKNKRTGDWYLVAYTPGNSQEWVEWWRLRKVGSSEDTLPYATPNSFYRSGDSPPRANAGDAPADPKSASGDGDANKDSAFTYTVAERDASASKEVLPTFAGEWAVTPDAADPKLTTAAQGVALSGEKDVFAKRNVFRSGAMVGVVLLDDRGGQVKSCKLQRVNLASGAALPPLDFETTSEPIAISADGKRVLGRSTGFGFGKKGRIDLWTAASKPEHVISFTAFAKTDNNVPDVRSAGFIDNDHAWTLAENGELATWEIAKARQLWHCKLDDHTLLTQSAGGKYLFSAKDGDVICFDALNGNVLGTIAAGVAVRGDLGVTNDGNWLVSASGPVVTIFDLKTGKNAADVGMPLGINVGHVAALSDGYALVGPVLFDLTKHMPVWQYDGGDDSFGVNGRCWTMLSDGKNAALVTAKLPQDSAKKAAAKLDPASAFGLKPGDKVAMDISVAPPKPQDTAEITDHINAEVKRAGFVIDPNAAVRLVVRTEDGKTVTQRWNNFTSGPFSRGGEDVSVTEKIVRVTIEIHGKPAWETRQIHQLGAVRRKGGQTIPQAVEEQNVYDIDFLKNVMLPNYVLSSEATNNLGHSHWALGGVKDLK